MLYHFHDFELDERLSQLRRGSKSVQRCARRGSSELRSKNEELTRFPAEVEEQRTQGYESRTRTPLFAGIRVSSKNAGKGHTPSSDSLR